MIMLKEKKNEEQNSLFNLYCLYILNFSTLFFSISKFCPLFFINFYFINRNRFGS